MRFQCALSNNSGYSWQKLNCANGLLHYKGNDWSIRAPLKNWAENSQIDIQSLKKVLGELTGHYAAVYQGDKELFAAVDQIRSQPLFYYKKNDVLYLVDDPYQLNNIELKKNNSIALAEFQLSGYAGAGDTLDRQLKSIPARHFFIASSKETEAQFAISEYLPRINSAAMCDSSSDNISQLFLDVGDEIFSEYCDGMRDRQIVLPLSSGYDSQYIAAMLKRHGHKNVLTYTYGEPGNWELERSRQTAAKLGFKWTFIPYSRPLWREAYESADMRTYLPFASRHTSTPHIQDWPAVRQLKLAGKIAQDAIFLPGHTCVLISNRLDQKIVQQPSSEWAGLLSQALYRHHFILQRTRRVIDSSKPILQRITEALELNDECSPQELLNAYFNFEAEERHGKMIINSTRVYEFWGYQWALPLWDKRMISAWAKIPYTGRYHKIAFRNFLYENNFYGIFSRPPAASIYSRTRERVKQMPLLFKPLKRIKGAENRLFGYFHEHFDWYGIVNYPRYTYHMGRCGDVYSLLSRLYLDYLDDKQK